MPKEGLSWQEVLRSRGSAAFVGRDSQLELFKENLRLPVSDPRKLFIFNVWGNAGVGKTLLLHQLRRIAEEHRFISAYIDESVFDPAEAMAQVADQFVRSGARLANSLNVMRRIASISVVSWQIQVLPQVCLH